MQAFAAEGKVCNGQSYTKDIKVLMKGITPPDFFSHCRGCRFFY